MFLGLVTGQWEPLLLAPEASVAALPHGLTARGDRGQLGGGKEDKAGARSGAASDTVCPLNTLMELVRGTGV